MDMLNTRDTKNVTLASLVGKLTNSSFEVRITAARAIRALSTTGQVETSLIAGLIDALSDTEEYDAVAFVCAESLAGFAQRNEQVLPAVIEALDARVWEAKCTSAYVIELIGPAAAAAVPKLAGVLHKSIGPVKRSRCDALGSIGPAAAEAIPALLNLLLNSAIHHQAAGIGAISRRVEFIKGTSHPAPIGVGQLENRSTTVWAIRAGAVSAAAGNAIQIAFTIHQHAARVDAHIAIRTIKAVIGRAPA